jgi:hypothetical protein
MVVVTTAIREKWTDVKQEIFEFVKLNMNCRELIWNQYPLYVVERIIYLRIPAGTGLDWGLFELEAF